MQTGSGAKNWASASNILLHVAAAGGWLYQEADSLTPADIDFSVVSEAQPTEAQLADLKFAWLAVKHVKSNAITVAKDRRLLGMGSGQPNRVESVRIALKKAGEDAKVGTEFAARAQNLHGTPFSYRFDIVRQAMPYEAITTPVGLHA